MKNSKSKGHLRFAEGREFLIGADKCLYVAPINSPLDIHGYRMGARFECMPRADKFKEYLSVVWGVGKRRRR